MTKRLFVAIDLPESTARRLEQLDPHHAGVRWIPRDQLHLTLGFFGHVPAATEDLFRQNLAAIQFHSFFLPFVGTGTFPRNGQPKILWIGVGSGHPHLFQIHKRVQEAAFSSGIEPELRPWHPHVTLARCRDVSRQALHAFLRQTADYHAGPIKVNEFHLYSSKLLPSGSVHSRELTIACSDTR